jgi:hypothetical protein
VRIGSYSLIGRYTQSAGADRRRLVLANSWLETGETITSVTASVDNSAGGFAIDRIVVGPDGDRFAYYASGGTEGEEYVVTFTVTTSAGQTREDEVQIAVVEVRRG